jgi:hypothetical protein
MKEQKSFYAVLIWNQHAPEKAFLGHGGQAGLPQLYAKRKDAVVYKNECFKFGIKTAKVVKVAVTIEIESNTALHIPKTNRRPTRHGGTR